MVIYQEERTCDMKRQAGKWFLFLCTLLLLVWDLDAEAGENGKTGGTGELTAESAVLMETSSGRILYEKNGEKMRAPASVTKVMTLLLIFEELEQGRIRKEDPVTVSRHAASMGGSQVFLEEGEQQTVETLIRCISIASANDACVAMAEHISGSESAFVDKMNEKAEELKMKHTKFVNCCGLDTEGHETCAKDIAVMSRELILSHPDIFTYCTIWMDEFVHKTGKGESVFGLSNTNRLLKRYNGCNGLKTGSTAKAGFCIAASAVRQGISFLVVLMGCPDSGSRMKDAEALFDRGFKEAVLYTDEDPGKNLKPLSIKNGIKKEIRCETEDGFSRVLLKGEEQDRIRKEIKTGKDLRAPVQKGETLGEVIYYLGEKLIGAVPVKAAETVEKMNFRYALQKALKGLLL